MKPRMLVTAGMLLILGGCASYDYADGQGGGYYRGTPSVQYRYPPGYYGGYYGSPYYGYGPSWLGPYSYPGYPGGYYHRPIHRPPPRGGLDRPGMRPPSGAGPRPSRPPRPSQPRPSQPRPSQPRQSAPSPWRDLNRLKSGQPAK